MSCLETLRVVLSKLTDRCLGSHHKRRITFPVACIALVVALMALLVPRAAKTNMTAQLLRPPLPTGSVIRELIPQIDLATGENCVSPLRDGKAEAMYYVQWHPDNPHAALVSVSIIMLQDCGLSGHKGAHGAEPHKYDSERFLMTLVRSSRCDNGWRVHSIKTRAHASEFARREINERVIGGDGCGRPSPLVMSLGKHALYTSWIDCSKRTPAEFCSGVGDKMSLNLHYVISVPQARVVVKTIPGFENVDATALIPDGWKASVFNPEEDGKLKGLPNPGNVSNDHGCPYGADWEFGIVRGGLCYRNCRQGYKGVATVCWQNCPSAFRDDGAYCAKPKSYGRGAGYEWKFGDGTNDNGMFRRCENTHGKGNCEKEGAVVYPKCKSGFRAVGCCTCSPRCPSGMEDIGVSCRKDKYDRGVGVLP